MRRDDIPAEADIEAAEDANPKHPRNAKPSRT